MLENQEIRSTDDILQYPATISIIHDQ